MVVWARMRMQRRWRAWLTEHIGDRWLNDGRYYQLNLVAGEHKNPEHRLTEDMRIATEAAGRFRGRHPHGVPDLGDLHRRAVVRRRQPRVDWNGGKLNIPGYLVIAVVIYCIVITAGMLLIARSFVPTAERKNQSRPNFAMP